MLINTTIRQVQAPPITEVKSWIAGRSFPDHKPLVDLCQAVPSYPPPPELVTYLQHVITDPTTFKYSPDEGLDEVREELAHWYRRHYLAGPDPQQLCLTIGASQAFWLAVVALCLPGDEVIIQLPAYFDHLMGLQSLGIKAVHAPFDPERGGKPNVEKIRTLIGPKTKALLLVTPSNPTGAVIPPDEIRQFYDLAREHGIALILDETYNSFIASQPHQLFDDLDWTQHFVHIASFGKTFSLTGLRCGALAGDTELIRQALKIQDSMVVCQSRVAQLALAFGCRHLDHWIAENARKMRDRHDRFKTLFLEADLAFELSTSGSFFAWIKHPWRDLTGRQAAKKLAEEANLICLPGETFGPGLDPYLRLAFGNVETENLPRAIERFQQFQRIQESF
ncbi:MAG: aminotransferase [Desulfuromonadales bacterium]|nr:aminotransferase [Desulfuromonadales bacterium]MBN2793214.1 aminotransferase [Desulfuromonadales bacterium]